MLKEWLWWQIEAGMEHLEEDNSVSISDFTICFWMALVLQSVRSPSRVLIHHAGLAREIPEPERLLYGSA